MTGTFRLHHSAYLYADDKKLMAKIREMHPNARFVEEISCVKTRKGDWTEFPGIVMYEDPPEKPQYPKFFALQKVVDTTIPPTADMQFTYKWYHVGLPNFDPVINAIFVPHEDGGTITISRYGHDFVYAPGGKQAIDGGRGLMRILGDPLPLVVPYNVLTRTFTLNNETYKVLDEER